MWDWGLWWVSCLSGMLVGVSEWSYGCKRVGLVYVVWIWSDFVWRERVWFMWSVGVVGVRVGVGCLFVRVGVGGVELM